MYINELKAIYICLISNGTVNKLIDMAKEYKTLKYNNKHNDFIEFLNKYRTDK